MFSITRLPSSCLSTCADKKVIGTRRQNKKRIDDNFLIKILLLSF
jgi:hypothetical protein